MKKTYIIPETCSINLETAEVLAGSMVGGTEVTPGEGEYDGEFQSQKRGWSAENWKN
ncbi:MAG: hypothetical protein IKU63_06860 [Bacteroidaceae bacterium]|nr:hypothetical protein [Bacteroidaceae bacterium]